jgi:hypothetical protein
MITAIRSIRGDISDNELIGVMLNLSRKVAGKLTPYQKFNIIELLQFIQNHDPYYEFILPSIGGFLRPKPCLKDETFGTFIFAETYFDKYLSSGSPEFLSKFIACYYRRGKFLEKDLAANAEAIAGCPQVEQEAILANYFLIREWFVTQYPRVFIPSGDQTKPEKSSWIDVYDAIVGDNIVQSDEYSNLPISTVLRYLNKRLKMS